MDFSAEEAVAIAEAAGHGFTKGFDENGEMIIVMFGVHSLEEIQSKFGPFVVRIEITPPEQEHPIIH